MRKWRLPSEEMAQRSGANLCVELSYADLTDADNAQTIALFDVKAKMGVRLTEMETVDAFVSSDATLISTAVIVGDGSSTSRFLASAELNAAGTEIFLKGGALALSAVPYVYTGDDTVDAVVTATAAKLLNTHTAGKVRFYFQVTDARNVA